MHPFDLRAAILAKHAQHVVLIHFPLALFIVGVAFDYIAHLTGRAVLASVGLFAIFWPRRLRPFPPSRPDYWPGSGNWTDAGSTAFS